MKEKLQFFAYKHLPEEFQGLSKPFGELAEKLDELLPDNPEKSVMMRKILEAKDCAVRASMYKTQEELDQREKQKAHLRKIGNIKGNNETNNRRG